VAAEAASAFTMPSGSSQQTIRKAFMLVVSRARHEPGELALEARRNRQASSLFACAVAASPLSAMFYTQPVFVRLTRFCPCPPTTASSKPAGEGVAATHSEHC